MYKNLWNKICFYCGEHESPVPMTLHKSETNPHYVCARYMPYDESNTEGHAPYETPCHNRISLIEAPDLVEKFGNIVEKSVRSGEITDYKNFKFRHKKIEASIIKYTEEEIKIAISNRSATR